MQNAGRIGGVLGDKTVVNLGCEEKKNDSSRLASHCAAEKRNQTGLDTHRARRADINKYSNFVPDLVR